MTSIVRIHEVLLSIYGGDLQLHGEPASRIEQAEVRLGTSLPRLLKEYLMLTGHRDVANSAHDRMRSPDELEFEQAALVFYVENQGAARWAVLRKNLMLDDPPVHRTWNETNRTWELHYRELGDFLLMMAYWQAVNGGLPNSGLGWAGEYAQKQIADNWPRLHSFDQDGLSVYGGDGAVFCLFEDALASTVHLGTRTAAQLHTIEATLQIEWDLIEPTND